MCRMEVLHVGNETDWECRGNGAVSTKTVTQTININNNTNANAQTNTVTLTKTQIQPQIINSCNQTLQTKTVTRVVTKTQTVTVNGSGSKAVSFALTGITGFTNPYADGRRPAASRFGWEWQWKSRKQWKQRYLQPVQVSMPPWITPAEHRSAKLWKHGRPSATGL
jgi:hypothetical protein